MAWYNTGTVTATLNSGTVTGVGTAFISNIRVGDGITIAGSTSVHEVTNIASETSLTISPVYPGTTGSGKTYSIIPVQGYVKDSADQLRSLIGQFGATITGLGTSSTLNATVTQNAGTGAINLPTASVVRVGEGVYAARANFGLYESAAAVNVDTLPSGSAGLYGTTTSGTKPPNTGLGFWWIETQQTYTGSSRYQRAVSYGGSSTSGPNLKPRQWMRISNQPGSAWGPWAEFYSTENLVGTVSQTSGTPTGAVIETGTTANGRYTKFADGTMFCQLQGAAVTLANASNLMCQWTYPAAFAAIPTVQVNWVGTLGTARVINTVSAYSRTTTGATCSALSQGAFIASDATNNYVDLMAIGRWY